MYWYQLCVHLKYYCKQLKVQVLPIVLLKLLRWVRKVQYF